MGNNIIIYKLCDLVRSLVVGNAADVGGLLKKIQHMAIFVCGK